MSCLFKAYLLQNADGWYMQKGTGGSWVEVINVNCLFVSPKTVRASNGYLLTPTLKAASSYPEERQQVWLLPKDTQSKYYTARAEAWKYVRKLSDDVYFDMLERDGYKLIEVEISVP